MKAYTRLFGEIDIEDGKIILLDRGMIGFPDLRRFALIFDEEKGVAKSSVMWFQSMDDPAVAFPVMHPNTVKPDYHPTVNEEMLRPLGELKEDNTYLLVTLTAAADVKDSSVNLKAPIVINADTRKGCQIITEDDYPIKFKIYDAVKGKKESRGQVTGDGRAAGCGGQAADGKEGCGQESEG